jgi:hypothetical protein
MESELVRHARTLFGDPTEGSDPSAEQTDEPAADPTKPAIGLNLTRRQQRKLWKHVGTIENFWNTLEEIEPGIVKQIAAVAAERRWEIIFLTKRPETAGLTAQVQSQRWLQSKGFPLPSVYVVQGSRGRIAAALDLDVVIDDRPENCLDVVTDSRARPILVWLAGENSLPPAVSRIGIGAVKSVRDCLHVLTQLDTDRDQPGVMERVRRLLGLKAHATAT